MITSLKLELQLLIEIHGLSSSDSKPTVFLAKTLPNANRPERNLILSDRPEDRVFGTPRNVFEVQNQRLPL